MSATGIRSQFQKPKSSSVGARAKYSARRPTSSYSNHTVSSASAASPAALTQRNEPDDRPNQAAARMKYIVTGGYSSHGCVSVDPQRSRYGSREPSRCSYVNSGTMSE